MFAPDRFEGNKGEMQEAVPQAPPNELELRVREQELKARYEDPHRKVIAEKIIRARTALRSKDEERISELLRDLGVVESATSSDSTEDNLDRKKALLETINGLNRISRESIRNSFLSLEKGELDIKKLAEEVNAIVVHAIPIDQESMKTISKERGDALIAKSPDVSASIISAEDMIKGQEMFYPFGFILDGKLIAAYEGDQATYADGDARRRPEHSNGTLQLDPAKQFKNIANSAAVTTMSGSHNESIVHKPSVCGILIDENGIEKTIVGEVTTEYYSPEEERDVLKKYGDTIIGSGKGVPTSGPYAGKEVFVIKRKENPLSKVLAFAHENYRDYPVYIRKQGGIYTPDGKRVTAQDIYS